MVPAVAGNLANTYGNRFVMLAYLSVADIGIFSVALKVASVFSLIEAAFRMAWGPFMWENFERTDHREVYKRAMKSVTLAVFSLVSLIAVFGKEVVSLLAPAEYMSAGRMVGLIGFSMALTVVVQTIGLGAGITKKTEYNTLINFVSVGVNIAGLFVLVPRVGLLGVPISLLLSQTVLVALTWWNSEKLYFIGFPKRFYGLAYGLTVLAVIPPVLYTINVFARTVLVLILLSVFLWMAARIFMSSPNAVPAMQSSGRDF
jgi:O-antigen/teichoic acid export membrane protein